MTGDNKELRQKAESQLESTNESDEGMADMATLDNAGLILELRVHQIELTMQNEELRRIQLELEKSRNRYMHLYDFAPSAYFTVDANGMVIEANLKAADLLGTQRAALVGKMFSRFIWREDQDIWYLHRRSLLETGDFQSFQMRMANSDGHAFYVDLQCILAKDNEVEPGEIMITVLDISARKEMEAGLLLARDELELRVRERTADLEIMNQELQEFSFIASHDLQEPLRKVRTFGDMITTRSGESLDELSRNYIKRMQAALEKMQNLLDSLLVYSRVTTVTEPKKNADLGKSVEAALSGLELLIAENNASVEVGELPVVDADEQQMVQVFQNLIGNAVKFKKKGEILRIKIYTKKAKNADGFYNIYVEDNGIGFEERYLDKIFLPFQRLNGQSSDYPGVGMGLAICKKIITRHGGKITATSEEGKGSTFMFTLPCMRERR